MVSVVSKYTDLNILLALDAGLDLLLVPGMGFDHQGGRLGRGGGSNSDFLLIFDSFIV